MKYKFEILLLCFLMSFCTACGNSETEKENNDNTYVETECIEENETNVPSQMENNNTLKEEESEKELSFYVGEYNSYDIDEPMLQIKQNDDETYLIQIGIYRLTQLDECIGIEVGDRIEFSTTEWGEDNEITGTITVDNDIATIVLWAEWSDTWFKDGNEYQYYKTSNIPNIYSE